MSVVCCDGCKTPIVDGGVDYYCPNKDCDYDRKMMGQFLRDLGRQNALKAIKKVGASVVTDDMVERATMKLLGHEKDTAPGVDWHCSRTWTVNRVRELMREALKEALGVA